MEYTMSPVGVPPATVVENVAVQYAGFWKRFLASFLDGLVFGAAFTFLMLILMLVGGGFPSFGSGNAGAATGVLIVIYIVFSFGLWLYPALMQSSKLQATVGMLALGLRVTDMEGKRISFGRASARFFASILSELILCVGYLMIAFTAKKQGLHDIIAGTLVLSKQSAVPGPVAENAYAAS
ncbi:MAG: RDD family protein [Candidatus Kapaibacterium sp.]